MVDVQNAHTEWLSYKESIVEVLAEILEVVDRPVASYSCEIAADLLRCVGLAQESHIVIQTWPIFGSLTVDVVACTSMPLMDILPLLEEKLEDSRTVPRMSWAQKVRGSFGDVVDRTLSEAGVGRMDVSKYRVASVTSNFQHIHVWDMQRPGLPRSSDPASRNQQSLYGLDGPLDRIVYLDDTSQSRRFGDAGYHETLVHPVMFAHENPVRVAIIGGGEGATLREVLKHKTVQEVVMIEIDEVMVNVSREYLPEWSYCGNLVGSAASCFDDPRTHVYFEDAIAWFTNHFLDAKSLNPNDQFDIVIMDALDPSTVVAFSDVLYKSNDLVLALYNSLSSDGLFVIQCGQSSHVTDPPVTHLQDDQLHTLLSNFEAVGFESIQEYDEIHGGFEAPWSFLAVMKNRESRDKWFRNQAEVDWSIRARAMQTLNDDSPFRYFDGATMMGWKYSNKVEEGLHCRLNPVPFGCPGYRSSAEGWESRVYTLPGNLTQGSHRVLEDWENHPYIDPTVTRLIGELSQATNLDRWGAVTDLVRQCEICRAVSIDNCLLVPHDRVWRNVCIVI
jgi:spermidine synthase